MNVASRPVIWSTFIEQDIELFDMAETGLPPDIDLDGLTPEAGCYGGALMIPKSDSTSTYDHDPLGADA